MRIGSAGLLFRSAGMTLPPARKRGLAEGRSALLEAAVVLTVKVAVAAPAPLIVTEDGIVQVGGSTGLEMLVLTAQVRFTWPVKPPEGVTLIVVVLPVVAPGATVMFPLLLSAKPGRIIVTVTFTEVLAVIVPVAASAPVTVTT